MNKADVAEQQPSDERPRASSATLRRVSGVPGTGPDRVPYGRS